MSTVSRRTRRISAPSREPKARARRRRGPPSFGDRLRYRWDTILSRGTWGIILWLACITVAFILTTALILTIFHITVADGERPSFREAAWQSLLRAMDPGTMAGDSSWALRVASLFITVAGIFLVSALIGIIAAGLDSKIAELRKGRSFVVEQGHTVVLGWSPRIFTVISELVLANENHPGLAIAVLAPYDKTQIEDEIRDRVGSLGKSRLVCRTGEPSSTSDLDIVNIDDARAVVVLSEDGQKGDAAAVKTVLAVRTGRELTGVPVIAEMSDERAARALRRACEGGVLTVRSAEIVARITAQACRQSGLTFVFQELLAFEGDEIYFADVPELEGRTFGDALLAFDSSSVIGRRTAEGGILVNPPMDSLFESGDSVIAISEDDDTVIFSGFEDGPAADSSRDRVVRPRPVEQILIVGWNQLGSLVLEQLDRFLAAGSSVDVLVDVELVDLDRLSVPLLDNLTTTVVPTENQAEDSARMVGEGVYTNVVILGFRNVLTAEEADARTLLTLLHLERALGTRSAAPRTRVVAELLDARDVELARIAGVDDFVVSDALGSLMMAQLAEHPDLREVFRELFDVERSSVHMACASDYLPANGPVPYRNYVDAARLRGVVAIGYRRSNGGSEPEVAVNPPKSAPVELGADDHLIVIGG